MEIFCTMVSGDSFQLAVEATAFVSAVKRVIRDVRGFAPDMQMLMFGHILLEDDTSLASCGVGCGDRLTLVVCPRPRALLEFEVWPERGAMGARGAFCEDCRFAPEYTYPATVVHAVISGARAPKADGVYCPVSPGDRLMRGEYSLRWIDCQGEDPAGWYITDKHNRASSNRVDVALTVRCTDDIVMDGTYNQNADGTFENGEFELAWCDGPESYDGICLQCGWYIKSSREHVSIRIELPALGDFAWWDVRPHASDECLLQHTRSLPFW